ncbi:alpha-galactosidase [bacterium]|nr:alpha-galactosidase [bacterium]
MYSTWYNYHQDISADVLLKEAEVARKLGFKAIIVDDGWQTMDSNRGYAYTGDWQPERIPNMKEFVDALHEMDMKILLWYAVPFMGEKAKNFERFRGKYLRYRNGLGTYVLDPRFPEVREYIINIYKKALQEWNLDGFKLDFITHFTADKETVLEISDGRDFASVNEAADILMTDIMAELKKVKPDIMIEFRQSYVGPLMRKYGNMFRVADCPNVAVRNRVGSVDLRLLSGDTAVHSDPIMWNYGESVEIAALQFLNILFAVPQVSVRLEDIPKEHFEMIKFLMEYWNENRSILLNGTFEALFPLANYPVVSAREGEKQIVAAYSDQIITLDASKPLKKLDIVNAKTTDRIVVEVIQNMGTFYYTIWDCQGRTIKEEVINLKKGVHGLTVPASGIISFNRRKDER